MRLVLPYKRHRDGIRFAEISPGISKARLAVAGGKKRRRLRGRIIAEGGLAYLIPENHWAKDFVSAETLAAGFRCYPRLNQWLVYLMLIGLVFSDVSLYATTLYWDVNGTTTGATGNGIVTGTWLTGGGSWNTDSTGLNGGTFQLSTTSSDDLIFSAGINATGTSTITTSGSQFARSLSFNYGSNTNGTGMLGLGGSLTLGGGGVTAARTMTGATVINGNGSLFLSGSQTWTNYSASGYGLYVWSGAKPLGTASTGSTDTFTFNLIGGGNSTIFAPIGNGLNGGTLAFTKAGSSTLTLEPQSAGPSTYTGATTIREGTLTPSFNQYGGNASNVISSSSALNLGDGVAGTGRWNHPTLSVTGSAGQSNTQSFASTTIYPGANAQVTAGTQGIGMLIDLATITRGVNSTLNLTNPSASIGTLRASNTNNATGIIGTWLTTGTSGTQGSDWVTKSGANLVPYTAYDGYAGSGTLAVSGLNNVTITTGTLTAGTVTSASGLTTDVNTFRFTGTAATTLTLTGGTLRLGQDGGVFWTDSTLSTNLLTITGGTLTAGGTSNTAGTLHFIVNSGDTQGKVGTTVSSTISDNGTGSVSILKSGVGMLALSGSNSYSGGTVVTGGGRLEPQGAFGLGSGAVTIMPGAQMYVRSGSSVFNNVNLSGLGTTESTAFGALRLEGSITSGTINLLETARIGTNAGNTYAISSKLTGSGTLEIVSGNNTGTFTLSNTANNWVGDLAINNTVTSGTNAVIDTSHGTFVKLGASGVIPNGASAGNVIIGGGGVSNALIGGLDLNGFNETINGLFHSGSAAYAVITNGSASTTATLTLGDNNATSTYGGALRDGAATALLALTKMGTGTITLSGSNVTSGSLNVNAGSLILTGMQLGSGTVYVTGGVLSTTSDYAGTGTLFVTGGTLLTDTTSNVSGSGGFGKNAVAVNLGGTGGLTGTLEYSGNSSLSDKPFILTSGGTANFQVDASSSNLVLSGTLSGSGVFNKLGPGILTLSGTNTFTGPLTVKTGFLSVGTVNDASTNGVLGNSATAVTLGGTGGVTGTFEYTGSTASSTKPFTIASGGTAAFQIDVSSSTLTLSSGLTGAGGFIKSGPGTLVLSGTNTFTGGATLSGGILQINSNIPSGTPLNYNGGTALFNVAGGGTLSLGALTLSVGDTTMLSSIGSGATAVTMVYSSVSRIKGATGNFVLSGGTPVTNQQIILSASTAGFIDQGTFFGGQDYAFMNAAGTYVRAPVYGTDANFTTVAGGSSLTSNPAVHYNITAPITAQTTGSIYTLRMVDSGTAANNALTLVSGNTLSLAGVIKGGGNAGTISGGTLKSITSDGELVFRTDTSADLLTVSSVIADNGTVATSITKSGSGKMILSGTNLYTGTTYVASGTLSISSDLNLGAVPGSFTSGNVALGGGTLLAANAVTLSANRGILLGMDSSLLANSGSFIISGTISDAGAFRTLNLMAGGGTYVMAGSSTYTGQTNLLSGASALVTVGSLGSVGSLTSGPFGTGILALAGGSLRSGTADNIIGNAVTLSADTIFNTASGETTLTLAGPVTLSGGTRTITSEIGQTVSGKSLVIAGPIGQAASALGLVKAGSGNFTLSGSNTFTGGVTINAGTLIMGSNFALNSVTPNPVTFGAGVASGTKLQMNGNSVTASALSTNATPGSAVVENGNATGGTFTVSGTGSSTFAGVLQDGSGGGALSFTKGGSGTLTLSGSNTYTGLTTITAGTIVVGASNALGTGSLLFGDSVSSTGTISIGSGQQLNLSGNLTVGVTALSASNLTSKLIMTGSGSLVMSGATKTLQIGGAASAAAGEIATLDLSGLSDVTLNVGTSGSVRVSNTSYSGSSSTPVSTLLLPTTGNGNTTITAATFTVGDSSSSGTDILSLGSGTNTFNVGTLNVSATAGRAGGSFQFANASGTLVLRGTGANSRAIFNLGTGNAVTVSTPTSAFDVSGHNANLLFGAVTIGTQPRLNSTINHTFSFDTGTLDMTSLTLGTRTTGAGSNTLATVNLGGGTVIIGSGILQMGSVATSGSVTATVNVTGGSVSIGATSGTAILMGSAPAAALSSSTLNLTGGTTTLGGNITRIASAGTVNASVILNGGSLDLGGYSIGSSAGTISLGATSGFLLNVGSLNAGTGTVTKSGAGTLVLAGSNLSMGTWNLTAGTVKFGSTTALSGGSLQFSGGTVQLGVSGGTYNSMVANSAASVMQFDTNSFDGTFSGNIVASNSGGLRKTGVGSLTLSGSNSYTGFTTVSGGTLVLGSSNALAGGGSVSVASGSGFDYQASTSNQLTIAGTLTLGGGAGSYLGTSIGTGATAASIMVTGSAVLSSAVPTLSIYGIPGGSVTTATYTLIHGGANSALNTGAAPSLVVYNATNFAITGSNLVRTTTDITVPVIALTPLTTAYWVGGLSGNTNVWGATDGTTGLSNWAASGSGAVQNLVPGSGAVVTFSGTSTVTAPTATVLGADMSIAGLVISDTAGLGLVADGNILTVGTSGVTMSSGVAASVLGAPIVLSGSQTWTNGGPNALTVSGAMSGTGMMTKAGTGTLALSGSNTFSGLLTLGGGTVSLGGTYALAGGGILTFAGGTLQLGTSGATYTNAVTSSGTSVIQLDSNGNTGTLSGNIFASNTGGLRKQGSGTITLSGSNGYTGVTTINAGTLTLGSSNALAGGGSVTFGGGTLQFGTSNTTDYATQIANSTAGAIAIDTNGQGVTFAGNLNATNTGGLTKLGAGTLTLSGSNGYTGVTTITAGTLQIGSGGTSGSLASTGTIVNNTNLVFNRTNTVTQGTDFSSSAISGSGMVLQTGVGGTLVLGVANSYTGGTTISGSNSIVRANISGALGSGSIAIAGGQRLEMGAGVTLSNAITIGANTSIVGRGIVELQSGNGAVTGPINITAAPVAGGHFANRGTGVLTVSGVITSSVQVASRTGTIVYSGGGTGYSSIAIVQGSLMLGANNGLATTATLDIATSPGTTSYFDLAGYNQTMVGLTKSSTTSTAYTGNSSTTSNSVLTTTGTSSYDGSIIDGIGAGNKRVSLVVAGGSLTLGGSNTFTGGVTINAGSLILGSSLALNVTTPNAVTFGPGAVSGTELRLSGSSVTIGTLSSDATPGSPMIQNANATAATLVVSQGSASTFAGVIQDGAGGGSLSLGKSGLGTLTLSGSNSYTGLTTISAGTLALGSSNALAGGGSVTFGGGALLFGTSGATYVNQVTGSGTSVVQVDSNGNNGVWTGVIDTTNSGGLTKLGAGVLTLSGSNGFTGVTTISAGTLSLASNNALAGGGSLSFGGGTLQFGTSGATFTNAITSSGTSVILVDSNTNSGTLSGNIYANNTGGFSKLGAGIVTLSGSNGFTGVTTVSAGTLALASNNALAGAGSLTFSGGTLQLGTSGATFTNAITSSGVSVILVDSNTNSGTLSGNIYANNTGGLTKLGAGVITLSGSNGYTGVTNINAGTLSLASNNALAGGGSVRFGGGTLQFTAGNTNDYAARITNSVGSVAVDTNAQGVMFVGNLDVTNSGGLTKLGAGTLTLSGSNGFTGITTVSAGTLALGSSNALAGGGSLTFSGGTLQLGTSGATFTNAITSSGVSVILLDSNTNNGTLSGNIYANNTGGLTKLGAGVLTLSGSNGFTGVTTISAGTLSLASNNAVAGGGSVRFGGGTLQFTAGNTNDYAARITNSVGSVAVDTNAQGVMFAGNLDVTNSGGLTKLGAGTLTLSGSNGFTGITTLSAGTLVLGNSNALAGGGSLTFSGGTLQLGTSGATFTNAITSSGVSVILVDSNTNSGTLSGNIYANNTGGLTKLGAGVITLSGSNGYTGVTNINAGTLSLASNNALAGGGSVRFGGGTLQFTAGNTNDYAARITNSVGSVAVDTNAQGVMFVGNLDVTNSGGLTKLGAGTLTLSGSNGFTGITTVSAGTLLLGNSNALAGGGSLRFGGGTLQLGTSGATFTNAITSSGASMILLDSNTNSGTLSGNIYANNTAGLTKLGGGMVTLSGSNGFTGVTTVSAGTLVLGSSNALAGGGSLTFGGGILQLGTSGATFTNAITSSGVSVILVDSNTNNGTLSGAIYATNTGGFTKQGGGTVTLSGSNSFSGVTTVSNGVLQVAHGSALGGTTDGTTVNSGAALELLGGITIGAEPLTLSGTGLGGNGALRSTSGNNTFGGAITLGAATSIQSDSGTLTLDVTSGNALSGAFDLTLSGSGNITVSDPIATSTGALTKAGTGLLLLSASNTFTGGLTMNAGTVRLGNSGALNNGAPNTVTFGSGVPVGTTLQLNGNDVTISGVLTNATVGSPVIENGNATSGTLTVNKPSGKSTFGGVMQDGAGGGSLSLVKSGAGVLALLGANTFTGVTNVTAGTLQLVGAGALASGAISVGSGTTLDVSGVTGGTWNMASGQTLSGAGTLSGTTTVVSGAKVVPYLSTGFGTLNTSSLTLNGELRLRLGASLDGDKLVVTGGLTLGGASTLVVLDNSGANALGSLSSGTYVLLTVSGTFVGTFGTFTQSATGGSQTLTYEANRVLLVVTSSGVWTNGTTNNLWDTAGNWGSNVVPGTVAGSRGLDTASFGSGVTAGTVTLASAKTQLKSLSFDSGNGTGYRLARSAGTEELWFYSSTGTASLSVSGGTHSIAVPIVLESDLGVNVVQGTSGLTVSAMISGTSGQALVKSGSGVLTLSASNTFTGGARLNAGTIQVGNDGALGSGTLVLAGGKLSGDDATTPRAIANAVSLTGDVAFGDSINSATLTFGGNVSLWGSYTLNVASGVTFGGVLSDGGNGYGLTKSGSGVLVLGGVNTFTGPVSVSGGTLRAGSTSAFGVGVGVSLSNGVGVSLDLAGFNHTIGSLSGGGVLGGDVSLGAAVLTVGGDGSSTTYAGAITGGGSLTKTGTGRLIISGSNGFTGLTTVSAGTLVLGSGNALAGGGSVTFGGGTLQLGTSGATFSNAITSSGASMILLDSNANSGTLSGVIDATNTGGFTKLGSGVVTLSGSNGFTGITTVSAGTLALGNNNALAGGGSVTFGGGTLQLGTSGATYSNAITSSGASVILLDSNASSGTLSGVIDATNTGGFTKLGSGVVTLSGSNGFTGITTVSAGTLALGNNNALAGGGSVTFGGGTLQLGTSGATYSNAITSSGASVILLDSNANSGTLSGVIGATNTGGFTKLGAGVLTLSGSNGFTGTTMLSAGTLVLGSSNALGGGGSVTFGGGTLQLGISGATYSNAITSSGVSAILLDSNA
ncbi:MAG: autotransporter-associated beta strand repeat-containing protein, partial [Verrucomicrobiota bacterium]